MDGWDATPGEGPWAWELRGELLLCGGAARSRVPFRWFPPPAAPRPSVNPSPFGIASGLTGPGRTDGGAGQWSESTRSCEIESEDLMQQAERVTLSRRTDKTHEQKVRVKLQGLQTRRLVKVWLWLFFDCDGLLDEPFDFCASLRIFIH